MNESWSKSPALKRQTDTRSSINQLFEQRVWSNSRSRLSNLQRTGGICVCHHSVGPHLLREKGRRGWVEFCGWGWGFNCVLICVLPGMFWWPPFQSLLLNTTSCCEHILDLYFQGLLSMWSRFQTSLSNSNTTVSILLCYYKPLTGMLLVLYIKWWHLMLRCAKRIDWPPYRANNLSVVI